MYTLNRNEKGVACSINDTVRKLQIPRNVDNPHYQEFLEWNAAQPTPLDLSDIPQQPPTAREVAAAKLAATDSEMIRVIEDIWDALKAKNLVTDSDLPRASADKISARKTYRETMK